MNLLLQKTAILDYDHPTIKELIQKKKWLDLPPIERKIAVYSFVRDEIKFGYNKNDSISASEVLKDGYGQCNTKGTLLMTLLRAVGIPCRFHAFYIDKVMQKGAVTGVFYYLAPKKIIHSWVEVLDNDEVQELEGFILDKTYMQSLLKRLPLNEKKLIGFGASTDDLPSAIKTWDGTGNTYIQKESITDDLGIFNSPDEFYKKNGTNLSGIKKVLFENWVRHAMNKNVEKVRCSF